MGEEVSLTDYESSGGNDDRLLWEVGLPDVDDLTPLNMQLIPSELASAFRISPELSKTMTDVNRASQNTFSSLQRWHSQDMASMNNSNFKTFSYERSREETVTERDETDLIREGSDPRKLRRVESGGTEEADSSLCNENFADDSSAKTLKRPRLVWTPQLHKRFIEVVAHLGIKGAVPKTIMQLMNVEGLTRENVASHLQKYRLYTKRMQPNEGPSSSDHLLTSTPATESMRESSESGHLRNTNGHMAMPTLMPYQQQMVAMPMMGMPNGGHVACLLVTGVDRHLGFIITTIWCNSGTGLEIILVTIILLLLMISSSTSWDQSEHSTHTGKFCGMPLHVLMFDWTFSYYRTAPSVTSFVV